MNRLVYFLTILLLGAASLEWFNGAKVVDFELGPNESVVKEVDFSGFNISSAEFMTFAVQTSSPISLKVSGSGDECPEEVLLEHSGNVDMEISEDKWQRVIGCGQNNKVRLHITSQEGAIGKVNLFFDVLMSFDQIGGYMLSSKILNVDSDRFTVSENSPFLKTIRLTSLSDTVEIQLTSENVENALDIFISFCPSNKGILYTTSYAPHLEILLNSPRMEVYYDAYSCDSNITFYSNSTHPVSPLIIRLESHYTINGTLNVLVNGQIPRLEIHVAEYETGTFTVEGGQMKTFELKYQSSMEIVKAYLDVTSGSMAVYISPCRNIPLDNHYSDFGVGSHGVEINIETLMANTSCALVDIDPTTVFLTIQPSVTSTFSLWIPGEKATWNLAIIIGVVLVVLAIIMVVIIYLGRRKTGMLVINYD